MGVEGEVQVVSVVSDPHLGRIGRLSALDGARLNKLGDEGRATPGEVVEEAVNYRWLSRARRADGRTVAERATDERCTRTGISRWC